MDVEYEIISANLLKFFDRNIQLTKNVLACINQKKPLKFDLNYFQLFMFHWKKSTILPFYIELRLLIKNDHSHVFQGEIEYDGTNIELVIDDWNHFFLIKIFGYNFFAFSQADLGINFLELYFIDLMLKSQTKK